jgi:hypothetical protein
MRKFGHSLRWIAALSIALLPAASFAADQTFSFSNLSAGDYENIVKEFSSNFGYSTLTPASSLGGLGNFELGVVGGMTKSPVVEKLVKDANPNAKFKGKLYHGGALVRVGLPYALTLEGVVFPSRTFSDVKFSEYSGSLMWTATDEALSFLPLSIAVKGFYSAVKVSYTQAVNQTINGASVTGDATIGLTDTLWGGTIIASKKILMIEPYAGIGYISANGKLKVDSAGTVNGFFAFQAPNNEAVSTPVSSQLILGVDAQLAIVALGLEYQRAFGQNSTSARLSFRF